MCSVIGNLGKCVLILSNVLLLLWSAASIGLAIWVLVEPGSLADTLDFFDLQLPSLSSLAVVAIVINVLVCTVALMGCCGAIKENSCLLITYFVFCLLLLIGISVAAYYGFTGDFDTLKSPLMDSLIRYNDTSEAQADKALVKVWDGIQSDLECCGVDSFDDWAQNPNFRPGEHTVPPGRLVPASCCDPSKDVAKCVETASSSFGLRTTGCLSLVLEQIRGNLKVVGGVAIGLLLLMIVNMITSMYLFACKEKPQRMYGRRNY